VGRWRGHELPARVLWTVGVLLLVPRLVCPAVLAVVQRASMALAGVLGAFNTRNAMIASKWRTRALTPACLPVPVDCVGPAWAVHRLSTETSSAHAALEAIRRHHGGHRAMHVHICAATKDSAAADRRVPLRRRDGAVSLSCDQLHDASAHEGMLVFRIREPTHR